MTVAAVLLAVLVSLLWCRSLFVRDYIVVEWSGRAIDLQSFPHCLYLRSLGNVSPLPLTFELYVKVPQVYAAAASLIPKCGNGAYGSFYASVPYWLLLVLLSIPPDYRVMKKLAAKRRSLQRRCLSYGYDLRATPARCPECGAVRVQSATAA